MPKATSSNPERKVIRAAEERLQALLKEPRPRDGIVQPRIELLYWLADHLAEVGVARVYLDEARSDLLGILLASTAGLARTVYLHGRSLLENLVRYVYMDSRPILFVINDGNGSFNKSWSRKLLPKVERLPHFVTVRSRLTAGENERALLDEPEPTGRSEDSPLELFVMLKRLYGEASQFIHAPSPEQSFVFESLEKLQVSEDVDKKIQRYVLALYDACLSLLAIYHIGAYTLLSQPIRTWMLDRMSKDARSGLMISLSGLSLTWVRHQREAALRLRAERRRRGVFTREGLRLEPGGRVSLARPDSAQ